MTITPHHYLNPSFITIVGVDDDRQTNGCISPVIDLNHSHSPLSYPIRTPNTIQPSSRGIPFRVHLGDDPKYPGPWVSGKLHAIQEGEHRETAM